MNLQLSVMNKFKHIIYLALAIFFLALSFNLFQAPNGLVTGGVTGIVLILNQVLGVDIPSTTLVINGLFLLAGYIFLGKSFFFKTVLGSLLFYPLFLKLIPEVAISSDMLVNALCGGIFMGIGISFLYISSGSSGGTSLLSRILIKYVNIPFAFAIFLFDGTIILIGFIIFGIDSGVYALIVVAISTLIANYIEQWFSSYNQVLIIGDNANLKANAKMVIEPDGSVVTIQAGTYLCIMRSRTVNRFKQELLSLDNQVIIIVSESKVDIIKQ